MPLTTTTYVYGVDDLYLYPITADSSSSYTLGTGIDVQGVKSINLDLTYDQKELSGDEVILDVHSKIKKAEFSIDYALLNLDVLKNAMGGQLVASGTTPNMKQTLSLMSNNSPGYVQLHAQISGVDSLQACASLNLVLFKCRITASPIGGSEGDYAKCSLSGSSFFTTKTFTRNSVTKGIIIDLILNETLQAASTGVTS